MSPNQNPKDEFDNRLQELLSIGHSACLEIKQFQPDLVVILLHSGWVVYQAAYAIWQRTEQAPFPPVLPVNIGREKEIRYKEHRRELPFSRVGVLAGRYTDSGEIGYFLNWIAEQKDWISWIQERVSKIGLTGGQIQRILILDDGYFEGGTFYLGQQLFESSFPGAQVHFLAGFAFEWRHELSQPWLDQHHVALPNDHMGPIGKASWRSHHRHRRS